MKKTKTKVKYFELPPPNESMYSKRIS